jgi:hypothetical protein
VPAAPFGEPRLAASWPDGQNAGPAGTDDEEDEDEALVTDDDDDEVDDEVEVGAEAEVEVVVVEVADLCDDEQPAIAIATVSPTMTAVRFNEPPKTCLPHLRSGSSTF